MYVLGIDPGLSGAFVLLAPDRTIRHASDMPVSRAYKGQLDQAATALMFEAFSDYSPACVLENVNGRPRQSAPAAFNFGHLAGSLYALAHVYFGRVELVTPQKWKGALRVQGKRSSAMDGDGDKGRAIVEAADREFPEYKALFRGPRGGLKVDVAEAALIALWGHRTFRG